MKKLTTLLCLLMLGMGVSHAVYLQTPAQCVLTRVGSTNSFDIAITYSSGYGNCVILKNISFDSSTSLNGSHTIAAGGCEESYGYFRETDNSKYYQPNGTISFSYRSGSSNSDYQYNISVAGYGYQGGCGYIDDGHKTNVNGNWSNVPVQVFESDGTTPITLTDESGGTPEPANVVHITVDDAVITRYNKNYNNSAHRRIYRFVLNV